MNMYISFLQTVLITNVLQTLGREKPREEEIDSSRFPMIPFPEPHLYAGFLCLFTRDVVDPRGCLSVGTFVPHVMVECL
jgi:hypothetical protein